MSYWSWYSSRWDDDEIDDDDEHIIDESYNNDAPTTTSSSEEFECHGYWTNPLKVIYLGGTVHFDKDMKGHVLKRKYCNSDECKLHSNISHCFKDCDQCKCTKCNCYYCLFNCHNSHSKSK